jgi:hypothetical protein
VKLYYFPGHITVQCTCLVSTHVSRNTLFKPNWGVGGVLLKEKGERSKSFKGTVYRLFDNGQVF